MTARPTDRAPLSIIARRALTSAGVLCVAIGAVGVVVPLLPTTPFLLLAFFTAVVEPEPVVQITASNRRMVSRRTWGLSGNWSIKTY